MHALKPLSNFFNAIKGDPRIGITHICLYVALLEYWQEHQYKNPLQAFSYEIMVIARFSASTTYHKCIRELSMYGYIKYKPSRKKNKGSMIQIVL